MVTWVHGIVIIMALPHDRLGRPVAYLIISDKNEYANIYIYISNRTMSYGNEKGARHLTS